MNVNPYAIAALCAGKFFLRISYLDNAQLHLQLADSAVFSAATTKSVGDGG